MLRSLNRVSSLFREGLGCQARSYADAASGPVYVVFGAAGGIGAALSQRLVAQPSASVLLCGRNEERLGNLVDSIKGGTPFVANPLEKDSADAAIAKALEHFGRVDGVANCVGSLLLKGVHTTSEQEFRESWEINTLSAFHVVKAAVKPMMRGGGGSILLFSSAVARHGVPNHEAVASAKAGVYGLALSAAATYAPRNVRVNCVAPGMTATPLASKITSSEAALKASAAMHPLKRIGEPDEPAAVAEMLLNPCNSNITGQLICVDGGLGSIKST